MAFSVINFGENPANLLQADKRDVVYYRKGVKPAPDCNVLLANEAKRKGRAAKEGIRAQNPPPPVAVARRNARERNRVKQVNNGFATLRQHIPISGNDTDNGRSKKLSKVETLRLAVDYIRRLEDLLSISSENVGDSGGFGSFSGQNEGQIKMELDDTTTPRSSRTYQLLHFEDEENIHPDGINDLDDEMRYMEANFITSMHSTGSLSPEMTSEHSLSPRADVKPFILEDDALTTANLVPTTCDSSLMTSWWEHEHLKS